MILTFMMLGFVPQPNLQDWRSHLTQPTAMGDRTTTMGDRIYGDELTGSRLSIAILH
ncbi:MAG: hypothetical protein GPI99_20690 [Microcystis aeruginosa W13-15]|jgi:hypothetical protein|nr:hypothetical protein [Microcystis aeruginosa W13-16]NCQ75928.1 hypothetical protein [Microcystis aeruginosa W13-13]NCQ80407.1 hypothetical protein [Microcystis aeruginosa W13-15]